MFKLGSSCSGCLCSRNPTRKSIHSVPREVLRYIKNSLADDPAVEVYRLERWKQQSALSYAVEAETVPVNVIDSRVLQRAPETRLKL